LFPLLYKFSPVVTTFAVFCPISVCFCIELGHLRVGIFMNFTPKTQKKSHSWRSRPLGESLPPPTPIFLASPWAVQQSHAHTVVKWPVWHYLLLSLRSTPRAVCCTPHLWKWATVCCQKRVAAHNHCDLSWERTFWCRIHGFTSCFSAGTAGRLSS